MTVKNDNRILPFGSFLRKSKINELPQLFNIFLGDMSVIGPRPLTNQAFAAYKPKTQDDIKKVRPGLSSVGSIIFRGEEDIMDGGSASVEFYTNTIAPYKGKLEEWFILNKGIKLYLKAIFSYHVGSFISQINFSMETIQKSAPTAQRTRSAAQLY